MLGSKNDFFKQKPQILNKTRIDIVQLLNFKSRSQDDINQYIEAFDYFVSNPSEFDGATIVKDLIDLRIGKEYLDLDAMLHDYVYISGANKSFRKKWKADINYIKNMEKNGKGIRVFRFFILTILGIPFVPYKKITG